MMKMQKNFDLELRLSPTSHDSDSDSSVIESTSSGNPQPKEESQRLTIFYNGRMCVSSDVTLIQAKSIISIARQEMDSQNRSTQFHHHQQQPLPNPKASMKKSLQSFLRKRKLRIQATSPYHQHSRR